MRIQSTKELRLPYFSSGKAHGVLPHTLFCFHIFPSSKKTKKQKQTWTRWSQFIFLLENKANECCTCSYTKLIIYTICSNWCLRSLNIGCSSRFPLHFAFPSSTSASRRPPKHLPSPHKGLTADSNFCLFTYANPLNWLLTGILCKCFTHNLLYPHTIPYCSSLQLCDW